MRPATLLRAALPALLALHPAATGFAQDAANRAELPDGVSIAYVTDGDPGGEPLVLVPGTGMQLVDWPRQLIDGLVDSGFWVVRLDNRDVGLSTVHEDAGVPSQEEIEGALAAGEYPLPYDMRDLGRDVLGLLDALDVPAAHLVGVSMGGTIAVWAALEAPERVLSLTLVGTASGNPEQPILAEPEAFAEVPPPPPADAGYEAFEAYWVALGRALAGEAYPPDEGAARASARRYYERWYDEAAVLRQQTAVAVDFFVHGLERFQRLPEVAVPTVVVHGDDDPLVPVSSGIELAESIPGAELRLVPGLGHDIPDAVVPQLLDAVLAATGRAVSAP